MTLLRGRGGEKMSSSFWTRNNSALMGIFCRWYLLPELAHNHSAHLRIKSTQCFLTYNPLALHFACVPIPKELVSVGGVILSWIYVLKSKYYGISEGV